MLDWALAQPEAPPGIQKQGNVVYARSCYLLGRAYLQEQSDWRAAIRWIGKAIELAPLWVFKELTKTALFSAGRRALPLPIVRAIRAARKSATG